jgi:hypothetical protein
MSRKFKVLNLKKSFYFCDFSTRRFEDFSWRWLRFQLVLPLVLMLNRRLVLQLNLLPRLIRSLIPQLAAFRKARAAHSAACGGTCRRAAEENRSQLIGCSMNLRENLLRIFSRNPCFNLPQQLSARMDHLAWFSSSSSSSPRSS